MGSACGRQPRVPPPCSRHEPEFVESFSEWTISDIGVTATPPGSLSEWSDSVAGRSKPSVVDSNNTSPVVGDLGFPVPDPERSLERRRPGPRRRNPKPNRNCLGSSLSMLPPSETSCVELILRVPEEGVVVAPLSNNNSESSEDTDGLEKKANHRGLEVMDTSGFFFVMNGEDDTAW